MSNIKVEPYLFFKGNAQEAIKFYQSIFGGEIETMTYKDMNMPLPVGFTETSLMHASLKGGDVDLMVSDTEEASEKATKVTISLGSDDEEKLTSYFNALSEGVTVQYPLKKEVWGDTFGMLTDKFGIDWMVNIESRKT